MNGWMHTLERIRAVTQSKLTTEEKMLQKKSINKQDSNNNNQVKKQITSSAIAVYPANVLSVALLLPSVIERFSRSRASPQCCRRRTCGHVVVLRLNYRVAVAQVGATMVAVAVASGCAASSTAPDSHRFRCRRAGAPLPNTDVCGGSDGYREKKIVDQ